MPELLRKHWRHFLVFSFAAFALRLFFIRRFPFLAGDALIYGDIAMNWLRHGIFGMTGADGPCPTLIRVPGYPAFLAAIFAIFGPEHYGAVMYTQMLADIATCFVVADIARRTSGERAAVVAFALAALCPFTANYVSTALTETLCLLFTALALDFYIKTFATIKDRRSGLTSGIGCGLSIACALYLRPDSGLLLITFGMLLVAQLLRTLRQPGGTLLSDFVRSPAVAAGTLIAISALAPLIPWTARNWRTFHVFQPLAPYHATDPDEFVPSGFPRWTKTWLIEYASMEDFSFKVPGETISADQLPARACDDAEQCSLTRGLIAEYNTNASLTPALDRQFDELARARVATHPLRYHVVLPLLRTADMWLRPRIDMLPVDIHWWRVNEDPHDSFISIGFGLLNLLLLAIALASAFVNPPLRYAAPLALYIVLRTVFLGVAGASESRYMIECYPAIFVFAAHWLATRKRLVPSF